MSDLISRDETLKVLRGKAIAKYPNSFSYGLFAAANEILDIPAVDAAKVVRCKDCIRWYEREQVCLKIYSDSGCHYSAWQERKPDDFCSYGERKEE